MLCTPLLRHILHVKYLCVLAVVFFLLTGQNSFALDSFYHNPDEILTELQTLQQDFPEWVKVDSIGHGSAYGMPVYMAKLSDNPDRQEPEPAVLFIGQVHAEEVEGVEVTLHLMRLLLDSLEVESYRNRMEGLEIYFIPTANPEGLDVVHSELDVTFRKNCRDNIGDGEFRFGDRWGWDSSGVDLNRNFGTHWDRGLDLFEREDELAVYNYYRGSAPFSEPETQALVSLALEKRFQYSLCYHSSRSGNNSESVIAPYNWEGKDPADVDAIDAFLNAVAGSIPYQNGGGTYDPRHALQRVGQSPDWFYQAVGTFQLMVEIGAQIQPDSAIMQQLVTDHEAAAMLVMDLALGQEIMEGFGNLTVLATDAATGQPLEVTIVIDQLNDPMLEPRKTSVETGRFDWLLPEDVYDVSFHAAGYEQLIYEELDVVSGERRYLTPELTPLEIVRIQFRAHDRVAGSPLAGKLTMVDQNQDSTVIGMAERGSMVDIPVGIYHIELTVDDYLPVLRDMGFSEGRIVDFQMTPSEMVFDEEFNQFQNWERGGLGQRWATTERDGRSCLTESLHTDYPANSSVWLLVNTGVEIDSLVRTSIRLIHRPYFEPGSDSGNLNIWDWREQGEQLVTIASFSQFPDGWDTTWVNLDNFGPGEIWLKFEVISDGILEEDGWLIDRLSLFQGPGVSEVAGNITLPVAFSFEVYPNPFNEVLRLNVNLPSTQLGRIDLYNAIGQRVAVITDEKMHSGENQFTFNASAWASGSYYIQYRSETLVRVLPVTFLK